MENNLPLVSIIIPCRNEENYITGCLNAVADQDYPRELMEIMVVDGMSRDQTKEIVLKIAKKNPSIRLLENPKKITPAAFNTGIRNAKGELIFLMGAHASYAKDYVRRCVEFSRKTGADNVGGTVRIIPRGKSLISKAIASSIASPFGSGNARYKTGAAKKICETDTVFGGCYKREVFKKIGLFNEDLARSQDMELNIRLKRSGGKIMFNPGITAYYYSKPSLKGFFVHNFLDGVWAIYPAKFIKMPFKARHYIPLFFVAALIGLVAAAFFWPPTILVLVAGVILYLAVSLFFSARIAIKEKDLRYVFFMPPAFAARHFGYGIGSIWGLFKLVFDQK
jgi:glycosyltransferase involved in cell wall biosynthesis